MEGLILTPPELKLLDNQYYPNTYPKDFIFLHHTAGTNSKGVIEWWNSKPDHIATAYLIGRSGNVYELFDPHYWSYALGVKGGTPIEKSSIHIELVAMGQLTEKDGKFYSELKKDPVPKEEVVTLNKPWRGFLHFHKYTDAQISSLKSLLLVLMKDFGIKKQPNWNEGFMEYRNPFQNKLTEGIWTHTSVRKDKVDIFPQKEIIEMIKSLP